MTSELESKWEPQEPSPGFAERVVAQALRERRARRVRYGLITGALALAAAAAVVVFVRTTPPPSRGDVRADKRLEVQLGARGVAVLEAGAHITWQGDRVDQDRGDVFYRVEPGSTFQVHTATADVAVLGTCFRITYSNEENVMNRRDLGAGTVGAIAAAIVVIGVYEGKVRASHDGQNVTVAAGERAVADSHGVRTTMPPTVARTDDGAQTSAELRRRLAAIEQEKASLERQLVTAKDGAAKNAYDLSPDDYAKLAEQGIFKYQVPCYRENGFRPDDKQLARLGLGDADAAVIQDAYRHANQRTGTAMRAICADQATKPDGSDIGDCISKLFTSIYAQGPEGARTLFTQADEIRAGKQPEPKDASPQLKLLLEFSSSMKPFEDELAQTYGAEQAHRIAYSPDLCFQANTL